MFRYVLCGKFFGVLLRTHDVILPQRSRRSRRKIGYICSAFSASSAVFLLFAVEITDLLTFDDDAMSG